MLTKSNIFVQIYVNSPPIFKLTNMLYCHHYIHLKEGITIISDKSVSHIKSIASWEQKADAIIATGRKFLGTPYKFGAKSGQTKTFDCSSYTQYVYGVNGIVLPRVSRQQSLVGIQVSFSNIRKGDLLFFTTKARKNLSGIQRIGHVGIYIGNNQYLNCFYPPGVKISVLDANRRKAFITARRVIF